jgi:hypothetical protein
LDVYKRALLITNALALAANVRGFTVRGDEKLGRIVFTGHDSEVQLRVTEMLQEETRNRKGYDGKTEQEKWKVPTGRLRITLQIGYREGPSFEDRESRPLENRLNHVFQAIYRLVLKVWKKDREHRAFRQCMEEEERKRAEVARLEAERERVAAEDRARRRRLYTESTKWTRSRIIREYVSHVRALAQERCLSVESLECWTEWALRVASELDPTDARLDTREGAENA